MSIESDLIELLKECIPHLGHTKSCSEEMSLKGEPCWCGYEYNSVIDEKPIRQRIKETIDVVQNKRNS